MNGELEPVRRVGLLRRPTGAGGSDREKRTPLDNRGARFRDPTRPRASHTRRPSNRCAPFNLCFSVALWLIRFAPVLLSFPFPSLPPSPLFPFPPSLPFPLSCPHENPLPDGHHLRLHRRGRIRGAGRSAYARRVCQRATARRRARRVLAPRDPEAARRQGHRSRRGAGGRRPARSGWRTAASNGVIGTEIRFSLLLPDDWNHKFMMGGGGGFVGRIENQAQRVRQCRLRDGRHRHRPSGRRARRELGAQQPRAPGQLRLPRRAPHRRSGEGDHAQLLRSERDAVVLLRLLQRRAAGADGSAALPRRLRRHRRRRAGLRLHRDRCAVHQGHPAPRSRIRATCDAALHARDAEKRRGADPREVRCASTASRTA